MKEIFVSLAGPLMQIITPIIDLLIPALQGISFILTPIFDMFRGISGILSGSTDSLGTMEKIMGGIGITVLAVLAATKSIAFYNGLIKAYNIAQVALENTKGSSIFKTIGAMTVALGIQLGLLSASLATNAAVTFGVGVAVAVAAAMAGYAAIKAMSADDMVSPGGNGSGYGTRTLMGPEGAIALNNKDTVIAGTNLFPKGNDIISSPAGAIQMPDNSEAKQTNTLLQALLNQPAPQLNMDSIEVGTVAGMSAYSIQ